MEHGTNIIVYAMININMIMYYIGRSPPPHFYISSIFMCIITKKIMITSLPLSNLRSTVVFFSFKNYFSLISK